MRACRRGRRSGAAPAARAARSGSRARVALAIVACAGACAVQAAPALAGQRVAVQQATVALLGSHAVRARPGLTAAPVSTVAGRRPITGERTVLPVLAQARDHGRLWLRVRLPGRVIGAAAPPPAGWISASNTRLASTPWLLVVNLDRRRLSVYEDGRLMRRFRAVVGKPSTPTPTGHYFVEENVTLSEGQAGGPFALASSDRSRVLSEFDGGPGQIAIHGRQGLGGRLGSAQSHGCVRLANSAITWLAARIASGTPITISA